MPDFSVIIPTCDRPDLLEAALRSVAAQQCANFEVIVVNDGGAPANSERVIETGGYRGHVVARNLGVVAANGKWIAFLDDDDRWIDERHLLRAAAALARGAGLHHAAGQFEFADGAPPLPFGHAADRKTLESDNTILVSTVCYAKSLHEQLGPFDEALTYYADWDWYLRVARAGHALSHSKIPVAAIVIHRQNMSGEGAEAQRRAGLDALCAKHGLKDVSLKSHLSLALERRKPPDFP